MLKITICDDESTFLDNIEMFVKKYEKERGTQIFLKKYLSGLDLEDSLNLKFDIVFLDINMPGINGMELAKGIRKKDEHTIIMFLTSLKEYVFEGYQVEASGYLTKPISYKRFSLPSICFYVIIIPQKQRLLKRYTHTYSVSRIMIKEQHPLYSYCMETTAASKRLYNAALFRIRNRFTGYRKVALTDHELQVLEELDTL